MPYNKEEILALPLDEKKELASHLIDSILADEMNAIPDWKKEMSEERMKHSHEHARNGIPWNDIKKQILVHLNK
jgi:putative addiction module component (TIGR02574 family)